MTHANNAQYQRAWRARQKKAGVKTRRGSRGSRGATSKWDKAQFIAIDGEGESYGDVEKFQVEKGKTYYARKHRYTLLAASSGESLYNGGERITSLGSFNFLLELSEAYPKATFVIFAGGYDINHMLMYDFDQETLRRISQGATVTVHLNDKEYEIEYRSRKSLTIRSDLDFYQDKKTGKYKSRWKRKIILWDVFGFFQENFVGVMAKWLGKNHRHYELIKRMKLLRGDFENITQSEINAYNAAELETLTELMEKVHEAIERLDLKINRWDGAGAVAAAILRKHEVKKHKSCDLVPLDPAIDEAIATAYAGGRIEVCKIGVHNAQVWDYDINSAYPFVMKDLPCLACGEWEEGEGEPPDGFTLVHCKYDFIHGMPFYPLFYRTNAMQISFPQSGEGIYWFPEYEAALQCSGVIDVIKWFHFKPSCHHKPFHWIEDYYKTRQQWVKNPSESWQGGAEKIIKLGLNSLYGKTAQQVGGKSGRAPAYHELSWAGYVTSATRARLYSAAMSAPHKVIGFATDGIFTTSPLPFQHSLDKSIGQWDVKIFDGLTLAMAGVYWWHVQKTGEIEFKHFSRGFDKETMETPHNVVEAWKHGKIALPVKMKRLIGLGSACASETFWLMRGRFTEGERDLRLDGHSFKRCAIDVKKKKPHLHLVDTPPAINIRYEKELQSCSFPYPLEWLQNEDYKNELEEEAENVDTENV